MNDLRLIYLLLFRWSKMFLLYGSMIRTLPPLKWWSTPFWSYDKWFSLFASMAHFFSSLGPIICKLPSIWPIIHVFFILSTWWCDFVPPLAIFYSLDSSFDSFSQFDWLSHLSYRSTMTPDLVSISLNISILFVVGLIIYCFFVIKLMISMFLCMIDDLRLGWH